VARLVNAIAVERQRSEADIRATHHGLVLLAREVAMEGEIRHVAEVVVRDATLQPHDVEFPPRFSACQLDYLVDSVPRQPRFPDKDEPRSPTRGGWSPLEAAQRHTVADHDRGLAPAIKG